MFRTPAAFCDVVPEYAIVDGRMEIRMGEMALVMPLYVFEAGCRRADAVIAAWRREQRGEVVPIRG